LAQEIRRTPSVCQRYAGGRMNLLYKFALGAALLVLERWNPHDRGSAELLTLGYHVRAIKTRP
jgi:hypothetical protein